MVKLLKTKGNIITLLKGKTNEGKKILKEISSIRNLRELHLLVDKHELWRDSIIEILIQNFDNDSIAKTFQEPDLFFPEKDSLNGRKDDFIEDVNKELIKVEKIISKIKANEFLYVNEFEFSYDGITNLFKRNKFFAPIIVIVVVFIGIGKCIDYAAKTPDNLKKIKKELYQDDSKRVLVDTNIIKKTTNKDTLSSEVLLDNVPLPYLENVPIIDKGIYLRYTFNNIEIGGVNIDTIKINARASNGSPLDIRKYNKVIDLDMRREPFIEINYKGISYSIEVIEQQNNYYFILRKNIVSTMILRDYTLIK
jgi:hypothetical protein